MFYNCAFTSETPAFLKILCARKFWSKSALKLRNVIQQGCHPRNPQSHKSAVRAQLRIVLQTSIIEKARPWSKKIWSLGTQRDQMLLLAEEKVSLRRSRRSLGQERTVYPRRRILWVWNQPRQNCRSVFFFLIFTLEIFLSYQHLSYQHLSYQHLFR